VEGRLKRLDPTGRFCRSLRIQLREDELKGSRPECPNGCEGQVHRHGCYHRYADPEGSARERIQRYRCPPCRLTFSVLPPHRLPYRPVRAERLRGDFDRRAGIQTQGLDPPPRVVEAGCLQRAWSALTARVTTLQEAFGQLVECTVSEVVPFWASLRRAFDSVPSMLCFLSEHHCISLLGNYRCLRPPR
jgi:hypothetical protein